jgi:hypothetical protein
MPPAGECRAWHTTREMLQTADSAWLRSRAGYAGAARRNPILSIFAERGIISRHDVGKRRSRLGGLYVVAYALALPRSLLATGSLYCWRARHPVRYG